MDRASVPAAAPAWGETSLHIRLRRESVGDDAAVSECVCHVANFRVVDAEYGDAVERDVLDEFAEGGAQGGEVAVMVEMFCVHVGENGDGGLHPRQCSVRFVRFGDDPVAAAQSSVGVVCVEDAAVDDGGVQAGGVQDCADHGCCCGLSVASCDGDGGFHAHEFGEHPRPGDDWDESALRFADFAVVVGDGR